MSGSTTRSKKSPVNIEIPDTVTVYNKFLELEAELAHQKTARIVTDQKTLELEEELARQKTATTVQEKETGDLKEIAHRQTELAHQREEENRHLLAQLTELRRRTDISSSNLNTPQVIPRDPTYPTATSTPSGIWGVPDTTNRGNGPVRSLGPALQDEELHALEEKGPMSAEKAFEALEQLGGSLFGPECDTASV